MPMLRFMLMMLVATTLLNGGDRLDDLVFVDGRQRSTTDFSGQSVLIVTFCKSCPRARGMMNDLVKSIGERIEKERLPLHLVVTPPGISLKELPTFSKGFAIPGALWACDQKNALNVGTSNIMQMNWVSPDGKETYQSFDTAQATIDEKVKAKALGTYRYSRDGLTDPKVLELWWMIERAQPDGIPTLTVAAKRKMPQQEELKKLLATVSDAFTARETSLVAGSVSMAAYEALEQLLNEGRGLELVAARKRLTEWGRDPALKEELAARSAFRTCEASSGTPEQQRRAQDGFAQIAKKWPQTVYGQRAGSRKT